MDSVKMDNLLKLVHRIWLRLMNTDAVNVVISSVRRYTSSRVFNEQLELEMVSRPKYIISSSHCIQSGKTLTGNLKFIPHRTASKVKACMVPQA